MSASRPPGRARNVLVRAGLDPRRARDEFVRAGLLSSPDVEPVTEVGDLLEALSLAADPDAALLTICGLASARPDRFADVRARAENAGELIAELDAIFATKTLPEWAEVFAQEEDMWWAPVQTSEEVLADPQVLAGGGLVEVPDGQGTTLLPATPVDFGGTPWAPRAMAPAHGEHSDEILRERGRSPEEIAALREKQVIA